MFNKYNHLLNSKFNKDILWNILSFFVIGVIGVFINVIIIKYYNAEGLGFFNQVYAIYIFLSQLSVWGIHFSIQKYIPQFSTIKEHCYEILTSSLFVVIIISSFFSCIAFILNKYPGIILDSKPVIEGFKYAIPGLIFFSLNKVLLSYQNGLRLMKSFAFFNAFRFILMILMLILLIAIEIEVYKLSLILSISEFILFIIMISFITRHWKFKFKKRGIKLMKIHFRFGSKSAIGYSFADINSRVDVFVLGLFMSDKIVGIYSFASTVAEGFVQLFTVLRVNINPILTRCYYEKGKILLQRIIKKNIKIYYKTFLVLGLGVIIFYPVFLKILGIDEYLIESWIIFSILIFGSIISAGYMPFQTIFNQVDFPVIQTILLFLLFITNLFFNLIFVPIMGMYGAAIGTALAFILQIFYLKYLSSKYININI